MLWIGITGPMGSGKSTVARVLRERGYDVLDADAVVGQVLSRGGEAEGEIFAAFGAAVESKGGALDRRKLAGEVFGRPEKLRDLERIVHPRVRERVAALRGELEAMGKPVAFYDVPLLFEKKMESQFDMILVVRASREVRLRRAMTRTGLSVGEIEARWANQLSPEYKEARATAVVDNDDDEISLGRRVAEILAQLHVPDPVASSHLPN